MQLSDFDINFGPWLNYGKKEIGDKMDDLISESWSPFNGWDIAHVFIYCMTYAFAKGRTPVPTPGSSGSMPASAFKRDMRDFMKVVAMTHDGKLDVIADPKRVVEIGQNYAYAGFKEVYDNIKNRPSDVTPEQVLENMLKEIIELHDGSEQNS